MRIISILSVLLLAVLASGCGLFGGSTNGGGDTDLNLGGNSGGSNSIAIHAGSGVNPVYTWDGGGVHSVAVVRTSAPGTPVWAIAFIGTTDGIDSSVTHGTTPGGSLEAIGTERTLTAGVQYRVTVARTDGTVGWIEFTP